MLNRANQEGGLVFNSKCKSGQNKYVLKPITGPFTDHINNFFSASCVALTVQCHYALWNTNKYVNPESIDYGGQLSALVVIYP